MSDYRDSRITKDVEFLRTGPCRSPEAPPRILFFIESVRRLCSVVQSKRVDPLLLNSECEHILRFFVLFDFFSITHDSGG